MPPATSAAPQSFKSYCRFTPGRSSRALDGMAALGVTGIEIDLGPGEPSHRWLYDGLAVLEPIRPNAIDALLSSAGEPGATLFVQGRDFAAGLVERAPHLSYRADRWRRARPWIFAVAVLVGLIFATYALGWSPVKSIAAALPDGWRQRLGTATRESMTEGHKECADEGGLKALDLLTERLSKASPVTIPFKVRVYDWSLMNAFAVPGGQIVLTKGLIDKAESADEVAGVLAHEMGHGIELHPETGIIRSIGLAAAIEVMMGGNGGALANVGLMLAQLGYTRSAERQADHHALELLKGAHIAPKGLGNFFARIMKMGDDEPNAGPLTWLRTHPPAAERADLVKHQPDYPSTPALDAAAWESLKSICKTTIEKEKTESENP